MSHWRERGEKSIHHLPFSCLFLAAPGDDDKCLLAPSFSSWHLPYVFISGRRGRRGERKKESISCSLPPPPFPPTSCPPEKESLAEIKCQQQSSFPLPAVSDTTCAELCTTRRWGWRCHPDGVPDAEYDGLSPIQESCHSKMKFICPNLCRHHWINRVAVLDDRTATKLGSGNASPEIN